MAFFHREAAGHHRGVGALGHDPGRALLDASLLEQERERHAGPLAAAREPMGALDALGRRLGPLRGAVSRALDEIDVGDRGEPVDLVHGEDHRTIHHPVDHQTVRGRIDVGHAGMVTLEVERGGRDDPTGLVERREGPRGLVGLGGKLLAHRLLEAGTLSVGPDRAS